MDSEKDLHKGKIPSSSSDCEEQEEIVLYIGNVGLKKDGIFLDNKVPTKSQGNNGGSNSNRVLQNESDSKCKSISSIDEEEEIILFTGAVGLKKNGSFLDNKVPTKSQSINESSKSNEVLQIENMRESDSRISLSEKHGSNDPAYDDYWVLDDQECPPTNFIDQPHHSLFNIGSSVGQSRTTSFHEYPSIYDLESPYEYNVPTDHTLNFADYKNIAMHLDDKYNALTREASLMAQALENSKFMREVMSLFEKADYNQRQSIISVIRGSVSWMMVDEQLHSLFFKIVDFCEDDQLSLIVEEILSREDLFISAAFYRTGSTSIVKLIRTLKKTDYAFAITRILASRFYELTTHHTARIVIQNCLNLFGNRANQVLYEQAIVLFKHVAITSAGCRSLNDCIDTISGVLRTKLLLHIASASGFLSHDPYGNYVVQHVLELRNETVNAVIFSRLQGHFVQLAQEKGGSHVVLRCLESGSHGTLYVAEDIVQCKGAPIVLARDQFGNDIIQAALKGTKVWGYTDLYSSLVDALEHYYEELKCGKGGRQVISLIEDEIFERRQSVFNGKGAN